MAASENPADWTFAEHVRRRPGMYVGGLNPRGLRHCIDIVVAEQLRLPGTRVRRVLVMIEGNLELSIKLHGIVPGIDSGAGLADWPATLPFPASGLDLPIISAIAEDFRIIVVRDGRRDRATFSKGKPASARELSATDESPSMSVSIRFDRSLFPSPVELDYLALCGRAQEWAALHPATRFVIEDRRDGSIRHYHYPGGLHSLLREIAFDSGVPPLNADSPGGRLFKIAGEIDGQRVDAVVLDPWRDRTHPLIRSFVNGQQTVDHGSHVDGLFRAFSEAFREVDQGRGFQPVYEGKEILEGAEAILVAVELREPHFFGATKARIDDKETERLVHEMAMRQLPDQISKAIEGIRARTAGR
jgi:DNA gyrase/topoisomerase IV subunit B